MTKWDQLTEAINDEHREILAEALLDALAAGWGKLDIEIKDYHLRAVSVAKSKIFRWSGKANPPG